MTVAELVSQLQQLPADMEIRGGPACDTLRELILVDLPGKRVGVLT